MLKSRLTRIGLLAALSVLVVGGVLIFRPIDTGSSALAAPAEQEQDQEQENPSLGVRLVEVDTATGTLAVNLNAGGTETYTVEDTAGATILVGGPVMPQEASEAAPAPGSSTGL
jgi:hypothetical protein